MSLESVIVAYGYWIILFGVTLEGETFLLLGAFLAHRGYLSLPLVMLMAFAGTVAADQFFFWLGRSRGRAYLVKRPAWQAGVARVNARLKRWQTWLVIGFRFIYGMRTITPFVMGMGDYPARRFMYLNLAGAAVWVIVIGLLGYSFGQAMELVLEDVRRYELWIMLTLIVIGSVAGLFHGWKRVRG